MNYKDDDCGAGCFHCAHWKMRGLKRGNFGFQSAHCRILCQCLDLLGIYLAKWCSLCQNQLFVSEMEHHSCSAIMLSIRWLALASHIHQLHFKKSVSSYCLTTWTFALLTVRVNIALPLNSVLYCRGVSRGLKRQSHVKHSRCHWLYLQRPFVAENTSRHRYVSLWKHDLGTSTPSDNQVFTLSLIDASQPGTCRCLTLLWIDWLWTLIKQETLIG